MTDLMRNDLRLLFEKVDSAHAGLLIQRGLRKWEDGEKPTKKALIDDKIANVKPDNLYFLVFKRWLKHTHESGNQNFACVSATINGRLFTGLPLGGTLETGVSTHHTYGMPMIAGSSIKGAVRSYTEHLFADKDENGQVQYQNGNIVLADDKKKVIDTLFGADDDNAPNAGYLIWHDAWWIPKFTSKFELSGNDDNRPFVDEIITVHHQKYYQGALDEALDIESPIPNQQVAVQGSFYFVIEGVQPWVKYAKQLLEQTIQHQGLGSKTGAGYGYFVGDEKLAAEIIELYQSFASSGLNGWEKLENIIINKSETELIDILSKNKNIGELFVDCDIEETNDTRQKLANIAKMHHGAIIKAWDSSTAKNTKKAYKFIQKPAKENE